MKRTVIKIDEELCNGCGVCIEGCHEGALQLIDGKARLVSELYCDGLGACLGDCPVGAITLEERVAEAYDEIAVMERISSKGAATVIAHLTHLKDHAQTKLLEQGVSWCKENRPDIDLSPLYKVEKTTSCSSCPGSAPVSIKPKSVSMPKMGKMTFAPISGSADTSQRSALRHWPVQLHLQNITAPYFQGADLLLAADCTAFTLPDFHGNYLSGKVVSIACPKLDSNKQVYLDKLVALIDQSMVNTITVLIMEVPCCGGLLQIAKAAQAVAQRNIPIKLIVITLQGEVKREEWI
ncbi:MAG: ATP-binding protein [Bacteroidales bacterium]